MGVENMELEYVGEVLERAFPTRWVLKEKSNRERVLVSHKWVLKTVWSSPSRAEKEYLFPTKAGVEIY